MTSRDFAYWLQGFFELYGDASLAIDGITPWRAELIKKHLQMVFKHEIDPSMGTKEHQKILSETHLGKTLSGLSPEDIKKLVEVQSQVTTNC